jgi:hypothetical protein
MLPRWSVPALAAGLLLAVPRPADACPFCAPQGQTLSGEVAQADFILYGTLANAKPDPTGGLGKGTTDLQIELVIKPHEMVNGKKVLTIPRFVPPDPKAPDQKYLIFFNVFNGQLDPYRGEPAPTDSKLPEYLKGAIEVRQKDPVTRLKYFFEHLESPDLTISGDAYSEFGYAEYKEVRELAEKLKGDKKAEQVLAWLKDPNTRPTRYGLYGLLIGHCGKPEDAKVIRELLDDPNRSFLSGLDGVLAGYTLLDPKTGWEYLLGVVKDTKQDFPVRYAALKTVRFFWEYRPDVIPNRQVLEAMNLLMAQPDLADLPVEDLRKWKCWDQTPAVLALAEKESHNTIPIVNRAILKFALSAAPHNPAAAEFVKKAREKDPKRVEFLEDLLKDEQKSAPAKATDTTVGK